MAILTDILDEKGVNWVPGGTHEKVTEGWIGIDCPYCGDESEYHMGFRSGGFLCWKCGPHRSGDVLSALLRVPLHEAIKIANSLEYERDVAVSWDEQEAMARKCQMPPGAQQLHKRHKEYLESRGLNPSDVAHLWDLRGTRGDSGKLSWRIVIPITLHTRIVSWTTRTIDPDEPNRYIAASHEDEAFPHKRLLFGEDMTGASVIVHEGPFDVFATGRGAVATCGTGVSPAQVRRIAWYPLRIICFDSSPKAQERAEALVDRLAAFEGRTQRVELDAKDACEASPREMKRLRKLIGR